MSQKLTDLRKFGETLFPWLVLLVLLFYSYVWFFVVPDPGFDYSASDNSIHVFSDEFVSNDQLQLGDKLLRVGDVTVEQYEADLSQSLFQDAVPGQTVELLIERDGQTLLVPWQMPARSVNTILNRLTNIWWVAYFFWLAGLATSYLVRPKDLRWRLLILFNFLTAIWLAAGGGPSHWHVWGSALVLRVAIWLCLPVYLHFHWVFPRSLGKLPKLLIWGLYVFGVLVAVAQWFQVIPGDAYFLGFLIAVLGTVLLIIAHAIFKPEQRRDIVILAWAAGLVLAPAVAGVVSSLFVENPPPSIGGTVLTLPFLPAAYFYILYRRQLGGLEVRANRVISTVLYFTLLVLALVIFVPFGIASVAVEGGDILVTLAVGLLSAIVTMLAFNRFQRFIERRFLGMPLPAPTLLQAYADRIATSLDTPTLVSLLRDEVLPSLLIRQSAMFRFEQDNSASLIYFSGVDVNQLPVDDDIPTMLAQTGKYRPISPTGDTSQPYPWVRLALSLHVGGQLVGFWLLGRKDPDDYYAQTEIEMLSSLANQTAIALANILQARRLRQSDETMRAQYKGIPVPTFTWQRLADGFILVDYNDAAAEMTESKIADYLGVKADAMYHRHPHVLEDISRCFARKASLERELSDALPPIDEIKDFWLKYAYVPPDLVLVHLEDITKIKQVERELIQKNAQLQRLSRQLITTQEDERTTIARELHDDVLNEMAVMLMYMEEHTLPEKLRQNYQALISRLRQTIRDLRPPMLNFGLQAAIEEYCDDLNERPVYTANIHCDVPATQARFDPEVEAHLFRIIQQACENALRHAGASNIAVRGAIQENRVELLVEDDGAGFVFDENFDLPSLLAQNHYGLAGMRERAALIGARLNIDTQPDKGTKVSLTWWPELAT